jgi:hypothetical protein
MFVVASAAFVAASCGGGVQPQAAQDSAVADNSTTDDFSVVVEELSQPCDNFSVKTWIPAANYSYRHCPVGAAQMPSEFLENGLWLANAGRNVPNENPEFHLFFGDGITQETRADVLRMHEILVENFGGYDRWVFATYEDDPSATNQAVVSGLDGLGYFEHNVGSGTTPTFAHVSERAGCLVDFLSGPDRARDLYSFCNDRRINTDSYDFEFYGPLALEFLALTGLVHEYHHHVQNAHLLGKQGTNGNGAEAPIPPDGFTPAWWMEGTANLSPGWILRDYFDEFLVTTENGLRYDEIVTSEEEWPSQTSKLKYAISGTCCGWFEDEFLIYVDRMQSGGPCTEVDARQEFYPFQAGENADGCELEIDHWHLMARYLMHITSPETAMVSILEDSWRLGWHGSFREHVGMTMDDFYDEYEFYMETYDLSAGAPDWIFPPETPFRDTVNFWAIQSWRAE